MEVYEQIWVVNNRRLFFSIYRKGLEIACLVSPVKRVYSKKENFTNRDCGKVFEFLFFKMIYSTTPDIFDNEHINVINLTKICE